VVGQQNTYGRVSVISASKGRCPGNHFCLSIYGGEHWRQLANTTGPFVCGGDAALCQITVITCYYGRPME